MATHHLRYLRIAWTVFCGIACVLLIVLWVRSYKTTDFVQYGLSKSGAVIGISVFGRLWIDFDSSFPVANAEYTPFALDRTTIGELYFERNTWDFSGEVLGFRWTSGNGYWQLTIPDWATLLLTISLAALPWLRWPKQFSLRTLLIATTLVAVVLGLIVWAAR